MIEKAWLIICDRCGFKEVIADGETSLNIFWYIRTIGWDTLADHTTLCYGCSRIAQEAALTNLGITAPK